MLDALKQLNMPVDRYIKRVFLPYFTGTFILCVLLFVVASRYIESGILGYFPVMIPFISLFYPLIYPYLKIDNRKQEIDSKIPFFITNFGVLSISDVDRKEMLNIISKKKELKYLAKEIDKIYLLVNKWNRSLAEACRFSSKRTPSEVFSDFLDRFAYSQDSGENMEKFLFKEQETVMNDYESYYKSSLYDLDIFKELYVSIFLSLTFFMSFVIIIPFLVGYDIFKAALAVLFFFLLVEVILVYAIKARVPVDPVWHSEDRVTKKDLQLIKFLLISIGLCVAVGIGVYLTTVFPLSPVSSLVNRVPFQFLVALMFTPMLIVGFHARRIENNIKRKDENFPGFIRSLGGSASARGGAILESLKHLTSHDFGPLTGDIKSLYRRLFIRLSSKKSWMLFSAETGSSLIGTFSKMFVESVHLGSDPGKVGNIIADNFSRIFTLRKYKFQQTSSFVGIVYGLTAGIAFSMAMSFGIADVMNKMYTKLQVDLPSSALSGILYTAPEASLQQVSLVIFAILVIHSFFSSLLIRIIDGGHLLNSFPNFVFLVWTSAIVMYVSLWTVKSLISTDMS